MAVLDLQLLEFVLSEFPFRFQIWQTLFVQTYLYN